MLLYFIRKRRDVPFHWIILMFGAFIVSCGFTHFMEVVTTRTPVYRLSGLVKLETALVSWATVLALIPIIPRALALRSPEELEREIAERKRLEALLQQRTEEWLRAIAAQARCILWYAAVEQRGESLHWDARVVDEEAAQRFLPLGIAPGQSYAEAWYESRLPEDSARMDAYGEAEVRAGRSYRQEYRCRRLDGEVRWLAEEVQVEPVAPGRWRAVGVCMDITERKRLDEELRQRTEALVEANRRKDEFLAMLAHELRNPLTPMRTSLHLLQRRGHDPATLQRVQDVMERQVRQITRLVDDLLDVSRIARGKIELRREPLDLVRLIAHTVEDRRPAFEEAGLRLEVELPEEPLWVEGDPARLTQITSNLLHNAIKFTAPGGSVTVRLSVEEVISPRRHGGHGEENMGSFSVGLPPCSPCLRGENSVALLSVSDTGIGIEPEMLPQIFEPFTQADRGHERSRGGLGLGLALVKGLVELHGGEVRADSKGPGHGAEFTFRLPLGRSPVGPEPGSVAAGVA